MTAPTATSALPSSESRLANITGETLTREVRGLPLLSLRLPFSISHDLARALHSPGQNLTQRRDVRAGLHTCMIQGGQGIQTGVFPAECWAHRSQGACQACVAFARLSAVAELSRVTASWKVSFPRMRGYFQDNELVLWLFVAESLLIFKESLLQNHCNLTIGWKFVFMDESALVEFGWQCGCPLLLGTRLTLPFFASTVVTADVFSAINVRPRRFPL